jgi:hypothetical protein
MIHAVVGSHVGERGYLLGERPGAPEASYDARSKIGLHSNFPRSEPTKKNDRTPEISPKSPKIRWVKGHKKLGAKQNFQKIAKNCWVEGDTKILASKKSPKIAELEGT